MRNAAFIWENFGPMHADRCEAVARRLSPKASTVGIEVFGSSSTYAWVSETRANFRKVTVFPDKVVEEVGELLRFGYLFKEIVKTSHSTVLFFCHYERPSTLALAMFFRIVGRRVIVMNDSKFDDYPRSLSREILKALFYAPYYGAIGSSRRSVDYLRFLGLKPSRIQSGYNSLNLDRVRNLAGLENIQFEDRIILIVARLVEKKNLFVAIEAYSVYAKNFMKPRRLHIAGNGPLDAELRAFATSLGVDSFITWHGFLQFERVAQLIGQALCLLLISIEEQFGNVVAEAAACGVPSIVSDQVGARESLIINGVSGFVVEPDNWIGASYFLELLAGDKRLWDKLSREVLRRSLQHDASRFADAVCTFLD